MRKKFCHQHRNDVILDSQHAPHASASGNHFISDSSQVAFKCTDLEHVDALVTVAFRLAFHASAARHLDAFIQQKTMPSSNLAHFARCIKCNECHEWDAPQTCGRRFAVAASPANAAGPQRIEA
jgi:hypothetical protein